MHILLTRPLEDCSEMIIRFKSLGHEVSHLPLLRVDKLDHEEINFSDFKGIIFTSTKCCKIFRS
jgi:uroporphyrinogen-III synthase